MTRMLTLKFLYGVFRFQLKGGTGGTEFCLDSSADRQFCTLVLFLNAGKWGQMEMAGHIVLIGPG